MNEARRSPRIIVEPSIPARIVGLDTTAAIVELSLDGFRLESPIAFVVGGDYEFLVSPKAGQMLRLEATARQGHVVAAEPGLVLQTGFAFASPASPSTQHAVTALVDGLTAALQFD